jgi:hypothetical protein
MDVDTKLCEEKFVCGVLGLSFGDVDGLAIDESEFAGGESGTYGASDGSEHGEILASSAAASERRAKH